MVVLQTNEKITFYLVRVFNGTPSSNEDTASSGSFDSLQRIASGTQKPPNKVELNNKMKSLMRLEIKGTYKKINGV